MPLMSLDGIGAFDFVSRSLVCNQWTGAVQHSLSPAVSGPNPQRHDTNVEPWRIRATWSCCTAQAARVSDPVLGTPLGSDDFVRVQFELTADSHRLVLDRNPVVQDLQSAWLLLLFCADSRATCNLRVCRPSMTELFGRHDAHI